MEITWKHLGTTGTMLGHLLGQFEDHLAPQENCMDNTTPQHHSEQLSTLEARLKKKL